MTPFACDFFIIRVGEAGEVAASLTNDLFGITLPDLVMTRARRSRVGERLCACSPACNFNWHA